MARRGGASNALRWLETRRQPEEASIFRNLRSHRPSHATAVAYLALFFALGGSAYAVATIDSADVTDESLKSVDLKNGAAVKSEDVVNDNVTGGGLAGPDIKELTLAKVPDADKLDGIDSTDFWRKSQDLFSVSRGWDADISARVGFDTQDVDAGQSAPYAFAANHLAIAYFCPASPADTNGIARVSLDRAGSLFIDNGSENPAFYGVLSGGQDIDVPTAFAGEALTIQAYTDPAPGVPESMQTIMLFSVHRPGLPGAVPASCHLQGQIIDGWG